MGQCSRKLMRLFNAISCVCVSVKRKRVKIKRKVVDNWFETRLMVRLSLSGIVRISLHPIPFEGADEPEKRKRRKKWVDFVKSKCARPPIPS